MPLIKGGNISNIKINGLRIVSSNELTHKKMKVVVFIPTVEQNGHLIEEAIVVKEIVPVYVNFDRSLPPIGTAKLIRSESGIIYADIESESDLMGSFPAIGGVYVNSCSIEIKELGVCRIRNTDKRIKAIK